jgi:hypothetical protein
MVFCSKLNFRYFTHDELIPLKVAVSTVQNKHTDELKQNRCYT